MILTATLMASTLIAVLAASLATPVPEERSGIAPVLWELAEIPGDDGSVGQIADPARYTLQFLPEGQLDVRADCNSAEGRYALDDDHLEITVGVSTLALCDAGSHSEAFLSYLDAAERFKHDPDGALTVHGKSGDLRFRPSLAGVIWEWRDFRGGDDSVVAPPNPKAYAIEFLPGNTLAIKADCNRAKGTYNVDGAAITLTITGVTRALCAPGSLSRTFLRDLAGTTSHVFRDGNLYLALPVDAGILSFEARYRPPASATPEAG